MLDELLIAMNSAPSVNVGINKMRLLKLIRKFEMQEFVAVYIRFPGLVWG